MANRNGWVIQGSFIGGMPRLAGAAPPPAAAQGRTVSPMIGQHGAHLHPIGHPQAVRPRSTANHAPVVQRVGNGEAFQLPPSVSNFGSGGGQPLPDPVRQKMESFFSTSFADVRVHVGAQASSIGALAFTHGSNLYFAPGQYDPTNAHGLRLLGHELTHVVQQRSGRVRNPFGSGVAVVQDRILEAEADRLGARAVLHPGPPLPTMASASSRPTQAGHAGIQRSPFGSKSIQRTIHRFNNGKWEIAEPGTAGSFRKPDDGHQGEYFNDVTGKRSDKIDEVRAGLSDLMMITGSLKDVKVTWPKRVWDALMTNLNSGVTVLGKVTLAMGSNPKVDPAEPDFQTVLELLWDQFLRPFMNANGQIPYIQRQSWFTKHRAEVDIDVNFYKDRGYGAELSFHKDTAGDNLFVNLMFNNQAPTPATEWIEDLATPLRTKRREMRKLMPKAMRAEIRTARKNIREDRHKPAGKKTIRGGIADEAAFVSWVDELIWHATPSVGRRTEVSGGMFDVLSAPERYWIDEKTQIHRALRFLSKFPDTRIGEIDAVRKSLHQWGFGTELVDGYMNSVVPEASIKINNVDNTFTYDRGPRYNEHMSDITRYKAQLQAAPISLGIGQELAPDPYGIGTKEFNQRTRIHRRTQRQNSIGSKVELAALREARTKNERRSFLRTWVRVRKIARS